MKFIVKAKDDGLLLKEFLVNQNISKKSAMMTIHHSGFRNKRKRPFLLYL